MDSGTGKTRRGPRADSLRNRELLLAAARAVFAEGGSAASLEAVTRRAGVGTGTLYRHFPTREALFQAVYRTEIDQLVALAEQLSAEPDPVTALRQWLRANIGVVATKKGMLAALAPAPDSSKELYADSRLRLIAAAETLTRRARAGGAIRGDITPEDLIRALYGICYGADGPGWQPVAIRLVDVFIDGLMARAESTTDPEPT